MLKWIESIIRKEQEMGNKGFIRLMAWAVCMICFCFGCGQRAEEKRVVAKINDYTMTVQDFADEIKYSPAGGDKAEDLEGLLDLAIRKEILIQEAQRQGLDKQTTFMKAIERYWRQALIKELLDKESRRIYQGVSKDKQDEALQEWMEGIYKKANIKIYRNVLKEWQEKR